MSDFSASAPGKIILSGEYAVLFGKRGIAVPSDRSIHVTFTPNRRAKKSRIAWTEEGVGARWQEYAETIADRLRSHGCPGRFLIRNTIPLGRGMGSSTALIIAMCRAALGPDCALVALTLENDLSPGNSGIDFAVIWSDKPTLFQQRTLPEVIDIDLTMLLGNALIDTGAPEQTTPELVAWVKERYRKPAARNPAARNTAAGTSRPGGSNVHDAIETIGHCTERLLRGESLAAVMRDHHRAQVALGVVPQVAQTIIADIERGGGAAKVIGAGGRTGGGMVLALPMYYHRPPRNLRT